MQVWLDERWLDHPGAGALAEVLAGGAFKQRVARFRGYDLADCGTRQNQEET